MRAILLTIFLLSVSLSLYAQKDTVAFELKLDSLLLEYAITHQIQLPEEELKGFYTNGVSGLGLKIDSKNTYRLYTSAWHGKPDHQIEKGKWVKEGNVIRLTGPHKREWQIYAIKTKTGFALMLPSTTGEWKALTKDLYLLGDDEKLQEVISRRDETLERGLYKKNKHHPTTE